MRNQKELFERIALRYANKTEALVEIAQAAHVSRDTARKWMYGYVDVGYDRMIDLIEIFELSQEELLGDKPEFVRFRYINLDVEKIDNYMKYIQGLANMLEGVAEDPEGKILFKADEVPIFHFMPYDILTYFKLYIYGYEVVRFDLTFERFVSHMKGYALDTVFKRIYNAYMQVDSMEVWDDYALDQLLYQIEYAYDINRFEDPDMKYVLLSEVERMVKDVRQMADTGRKRSGKVFDFFKASLPVGTGSMIVHQKNRKTLSIKLDTINSVSTQNSVLIEEMEEAFEAILNKSIRLEVWAKRKRARYFNGLLDKLKSASSKARQKT